MKCPYNRRVEITVQNWGQDSDDNQTPAKGSTVTQTVYELMDCEKENCGAWKNGRCCYAAVSLSNE